ncbi:MBL fold metallo-hydrolase [Acidaminobacter sp. JC074]|uniref:MBL fold metallo-hydrolase n=1 Tax=Acidaminobacter sp. JC074 TaxID=2530199 RepID=UPI001F0CEC67|nr:MBL fold metallo-hydrolase [Acidaminobacter sp. JC074]MCH4890050.1 MBL fold metallo-hydrolase [Acidaminobacter sp. JC074]
MNSILLNGDIPVNCFFLEDQGKCYIIDPGYEKDKIRAYVEKNKLEVIGILLTHAHFDHIGALDVYDVPIYIHEDEYPILMDGFKNGFDYEGRSMDFNLDDLYIIKMNENTKLFLNTKPIDVILTPGHTPGCVCYKFSNHMFTGDTLFKGSVGQWDFPSGKQEDLRKSIIHLLEDYDPATIIYPAHGDKSTIGQERLSNMFYHRWKELGTIIRDTYDDYETFQKMRVHLENKEYQKAYDITLRLMQNPRANPLVYMYYQYLVTKKILVN